MITRDNSLSYSLKTAAEDKINILNLIRDTCEYLNKTDGKINSFLEEKGREERLLKEAEYLSEKYFNNKDNLPLYGALVGVKDIFNIKDFPTKAGTNIPSGLAYTDEADVVNKIKKAGALVLGKTVSTEFAFAEPGPTKNPHNLKHTPGGSSSGSAAAVSAGICPIAIGSETIASTIRPAAYCGVIGFRPSFNRISTKGMVHLSPSFDSVGLFTQDIESMEDISSILCNKWDNTKISIKTLPTIGIPADEYINQASKELLYPFYEKIERLRQKGYKVKKTDILSNIEEYNRIHRDIVAAEFSLEQKDLYLKYKDFYRKRTIELIEKGLEIGEDSLRRLKRKIPFLRRYIQNEMDKRKIDLWIAPSTTSSAPKDLLYTGDNTMSIPWTHAGIPAITLPLKTSQNELPLGIQLISRFMDDEKLLYYSKRILNL